MKKFTLTIVLFLVALAVTTFGQQIKVLDNTTSPAASQVRPFGTAIESRLLPGTVATASALAVPLENEVLTMQYNTADKKVYFRYINAAGAILNGSLQLGEGAAITHATGPIQLGETVAFTAATTEAGATAWDSTDTSIFSINPTTAVATATAAGSAYVRYNKSTSGNLNRYQVVVWPAATINNPVIGEVRVEAGDVTPTGFTEAGSGETIAWLSSDTDKATVVSSTGVISPVATGPVTISYSVTNDTSSHIVVKGSKAITVLAAD